MGRLAPFPAADDVGIDRLTQELISLDWSKFPPVIA